MADRHLVAFATSFYPESDFKGLESLFKLKSPFFNQISSFTLKFSDYYEENQNFHKLLCILFAQIQQQITLMQLDGQNLFEINSSFKLLADFILYCERVILLKSQQDQNLYTFLIFLQDLLTPQGSQNDQNFYQMSLMAEFFRQNSNILSNSTQFRVDEYLSIKYQINMRQLKKEDLTQVKRSDIRDLDFLLVDNKENFTLIFPSINLKETPGNSNSFQQQPQYNPYQQDSQITPGYTEIENSKQNGNQGNWETPQGLANSNSRCIDCDRPVDINFKENGNPPNRCVNCFEEYLADNF